MATDVKSIKIPEELYTELRNLQAKIWLEAQVSVSYGEILAKLAKGTDWDQLRDTLIKQKQAEAAKNAKA